MINLIRQIWSPHSVMMSPHSVMNSLISLYNNGLYSGPAQPLTDCLVMEMSVSMTAYRNVT